MPCFHPLKAIRDSSGVRVLPSSAAIFNLQLPCGQCVGCRLERSRQWATRCMHEASLWPDNCFVTLTYDNAHVPSDGGLHYRDFQLFMKRLRRSKPNQVIRYYMCGEYGENYGRPHFHAILFNCSLGNLSVLQRTGSGSMLFRSPELEALWPYGYSSIGEVTFESAAYVSRYIMAKVTGDLGKSHYDTVNIETGEINSRCPEFNRMSLKPGIGSGWFEKYSSDVFPHDRVIVNGTPTRPPKYYDVLYSRIASDEFNVIKEKRMLDALKRTSDNTYRRLADKEIVTKASISQLKRGSVK